MNFYTNTPDRETVKRELTEAVLSKNWKNCFCIDSHGIKRTYTKSEERVLSISEIGISGSCYDEETALTLLHKGLNENIDAITNWIISKKQALAIRITSEKPTGYIIFENKRYETDTVQIYFRRSRSDKTEFGFFVSSVQPCIKADALNQGE